MTQFEYLAIAFSLLYSLAALRILSGLSDAIASRSRDWEFVGLSVVQLYLVAVSFWVFYSLRDTAWTFPGFLIALLIPGALSYGSAVLMPRETDVVDGWGDHYRAVRGRWYAAFAAWALCAAASATVNLGMGIVHPARAVHVSAFLFGVIGATSTRDRVHRALVVAFLVLMAATTLAQIDASFLRY